MRLLGSGAPQRQKSIKKGGKGSISPNMPKRLGSSFPSRHRELCNIRSWAPLELEHRMTRVGQWELTIETIDDCRLAEGLLVLGLELWNQRTSHEKYGKGSETTVLTVELQML
jgi:hypothetical protein